LVLVNATFDNLSFVYDEQPSDVPAGSDVRVRVRFSETERQFFEHGRPQIVQAFAHARRLQIEPVCEAERGLRSPAVAAATTLIDKVRAWCDANQETVPETLAAALGELETRPAEDVVASFKERMNGYLE
jgi:hypothetical protein